MASRFGEYVFSVYSHCTKLFHLLQQHHTKCTSTLLGHHLTPGQLVHHHIRNYPKVASTRQHSKEGRRFYHIKESNCTRKLLLGAHMH